MAGDDDRCRKWLYLKRFGRVRTSRLEFRLAPCLAALLKSCRCRVLVGTACFFLWAPAVDQ
eukprot:6184007-Pleurochrysis_carterae.AAC.2